MSPPNQHFTVNKDEWHTKEDTGKSVKNALCIPKGTSQAEVTLNKKIKPAHSLSHCRVGISQSVSQSVSRTFKSL